MHKFQLGNSDLFVSQLCLGTMTFGKQNTQDEGFAQMDRAFDFGIQFFDTAELYPIPPEAHTQGATEVIIGNWMKARGNRNQVVIATKAVGRTGMNWFRDGKREATLSRADIFEAVDKSLKRLQTDVIDLYQLHWPDRPVTLFGSNPTVYKHKVGDEIAVEETLEALNDLVRMGKIRAIGLSNESAWGAMEFLRLSEKHGWPRIVSIQNAYNLLNRTYEVALAEVTMRENVALLAYSPLAQGYLTGKYRNGIPDGSRRALFDRLQRYENGVADKAVRAYCALAESHGLQPSQMAIAFCFTRSFMGSVILGATTLAQLDENLGALKLTLTSDILRQIDEVHLTFCNPCP